MLLLLSVRNMFSSIQDLGPTDPVERGNLGGAMTLLEKGFFSGEAWLTEPGTPMPPARRWSRPHDIPPEPQPLPWWPPQGEGFTMGCVEGREQIAGHSHAVTCTNKHSTDIDFSPPPAFLFLLSSLLVAAELHPLLEREGVR